MVVVLYDMIEEDKKKTRGFPMHHSAWNIIPVIQRNSPLNLSLRLRLTCEVSISVVVFLENQYETTEDKDDGEEGTVSSTQLFHILLVRIVCAYTDTIAILITEGLIEVEG